MKKEPKTTQIGLRIDNEVLNKIEELADFDKVDKMTWIRQAIADRIDSEEQDNDNFAIEDYIHGRISEEKFKEVKKMDKNKVPADLKQARADFLKYLVIKDTEGK
jgi:predicted transcriptional regulator